MNLRTARTILKNRKVKGSKVLMPVLTRRKEIQRRTQSVAAKAEERAQRIRRRRQQQAPSSPLLPRNGRRMR